MPAVLVEMGFLTNEAECKKLIDEEYRTKLAEGIVHGIIDYLNSVLDEKTERSNDYAPFFMIL
jgi:N-acetylmuramoyl-L-alanine amidase